MDYRQYFEKFVEDFRKEFDQKQLYEQKIDELNNQHSMLMQKLDSLITALNHDKQQNNSLFLDNNQFSKLMNISKRTAQQWRDNSVISYSQVGNKIFYRITDIEKLLQDNYIKAKKEI